MKKTAFTMIELIFVIVVIGILAAMIIPRLDRDNRFEAATQVLNHIKYTQHLAMTEDVFNDQDPNWYLERWEIQFYGCGGYVVYRDDNQGGGPDRNESAVDPQTRKRLFTTNVCAESVLDFDKISLMNHYDVNNIGTNAGCGGLDISFDNLGRPYRSNNINDVVKQNCEITLTFNTPGATEVVRIHPETGYACILDAAGNDCL